MRITRTRARVRADAFDAGIENLDRRRNIVGGGEHVFPGDLACHLLLESGKRSERIEDAVVQIELAFRDVTSIVWNRVRNVITRHCRHGENRNGPGPLVAAGSLVPHGQLTV